MEDIEEFSEQDTDCEQDGEDFELASDNAIIDRTSSPETIPVYLEDVPVNKLQLGYYLGKDGATKWKGLCTISECTNSVSQHCSGNRWMLGHAKISP
ncbi:unnamed protein product [Parnassius apollo]|uniref:(apollo) hypothetical protein n=1 Tax=Parnassius apollo TaxID=110799 RepID=A0A8S3XFA3_PARAO|nr:unnamed protein product [Parnassius apollo]